ncbi:ATP-binding protein [Aerococcaceae bacterium NML130460]|nr:ATP-binding protein [Aerococcaceae bacterium NML130460]
MMQTINNQVNNHALLQKALNTPLEEKESIKQQILSDLDVQLRLQEFGDVVDGAMIDRGINVLNEYRRMLKEDPYHEPKLIIASGNFQVTYVQRKEIAPLMNKPQWKRKLDLTMMSLDNQQATLESYDKPMERLQAIGEVKRIVNDYEDNKRVTGIWLHGRNGNGKSCLMCALANKLNKDKLAGVTMVNLSMLINELYADLKRNSDSGNFQRRIKHLKFVDVLIIDEIGAENLTDWVMDSVLFEILETRNNQNKLTLFTSNLTKQDYYNRLLNANSRYGAEVRAARAKRIMTRIDALTKEVHLGGGNRREAHQ